VETESTQNGLHHVGHYARAFNVKDETRLAKLTDYEIDCLQLVVKQFAANIEKVDECRQEKRLHNVVKARLIVPHVAEVIVDRLFDVSHIFALLLPRQSDRLSFLCATLDVIFAQVVVIKVVVGFVGSESKRGLDDGGDNESAHKARKSKFQNHSQIPRPIGLKQVEAVELAHQLLVDADCIRVDDDFPSNLLPVVTDFVEKESENGLVRSCTFLTELFDSVEIA